MSNQQLNASPIYRDKECIACGRKYPQTILNIEGVIHHSCNYLCLNTKECNKFVRAKEKLAKKRRKSFQTVEKYETGFA